MAGIRARHRVGEALHRKPGEAMVTSPLWISLADFCLKVATFLKSERDSYSLERRQDLDRVANYLDGISAALNEAVETFATKRLMPRRQMAHIEYALYGMREILEEAWSDD